MVLVADKDMQAAILQLLDRPESVRIRKISHDVLLQENHDSGVFRFGHDYLRTQCIVISMRFLSVTARDVVVNIVGLGKTWNGSWRNDSLQMDGMIAPGRSWSILNWKVWFGPIPGLLRTFWVRRDKRKICGVGSAAHGSCKSARLSRSGRKKLG